MYNSIRKNSHAGVLIVFLLQFTFILNPVSATGNSGLKLQSKNGNGQIISSVQTDETVNWVSTYEPSQRGVSATFTSADENQWSNHSYIPDSFKTPPGWTREFSENRGLSYTLSEPRNTNKIRSFNESVVTKGTGLSTLINPVKPLNISLGTGGDGYTPVIYKDKIYSLFHHQLANLSQNKYNIQCVDALSQNICEGWGAGKIFFDQNDVNDKITTSLTPKYIQVNSKIYYAAHKINGDFGIGCFDFETATNCPFFKVSNLPVNLSGNGWPAMVDGIVKRGDYVFLIDTNYKMWCVNAQSWNNPVNCGATDLNSTDTSIVDYSGDFFGAPMELIGDKIYVLSRFNKQSVETRDNVKVMCFDATLKNICQGWTNLVVSSSNADYINYWSIYDFTDKGICVAGDIVREPSKCWNYEGTSPISPPANIFTSLPPTLPTLYYRAREEFKFDGKTYFAINISNVSGGSTLCYDFLNETPCAGFGTNGIQNWIDTSIGETVDYGYAYYNGCMYGLGDKGIMWSFNPYTGSQCYTSVKNISVAEPDQTFYCDGQVHTVSWDKIGIYGDLSVLTSAKVRINDSTGKLIKSVIFPSGGNTVDISDIPYGSTTSILGEIYNTSTLKVVFEIEGISSWEAPIRAEVTFKGDNPQFCYQTKVVSECSVSDINNSVSVNEGKNIFSDTSKLSVSTSQSKVCPSPAVITPIPSPVPTKVPMLEETGGDIRKEFYVGIMMVLYSIYVIVYNFNKKVKFLKEYK